MTTQENAAQPSRDDIVAFAKHALAALREQYERASVDDCCVMEEAANAIVLLLKVVNS
jgi:hypothetical protein